MRISDWSSDVCSSDLTSLDTNGKRGSPPQLFHRGDELADGLDLGLLVHADDDVECVFDLGDEIHHRQAVPFEVAGEGGGVGQRSEEHTSELQSLMRISYAVFCLKKKKEKNVDITN